MDKIGKLSLTLLIIAAVIILVAVCFFTAFILVPKMGLIPGLIVVGASIPFLIAIYASYLPQDIDKK